MFKDLYKKFFRHIGFIALKVVTAVPAGLPLKVNYAIGGLLGNFLYIILFPHRRIAFDSLSVAFPSMNKKQKAKIARDFFIFMAQGGMEMIYFLRHPEALSGIRIEGRENLEKALKQNRGAVMVAAHYGNFPLMSLKLAKEGFAINFMARQMRDPKAGAYLHEMRSNAGVKAIYTTPRRECVTNTINALRVNEIVIIQMDQNFGTNGVWVRFFGELAATPTGPIVFAQRTNAMIVPAYIYREGLGKHCIKILPPEDLIVKEDKDEMILVNVAKFTRMFESWITAHPHEWSWIHRRWKSRPDEKAYGEKFTVEK
jgi:KDO2-lipid IV(A) lauroyltransferase